MANPIIKFLGMFDKVDDIVYEPIKVICDGFRQPLKQIDAATERKKMELNHKLEVEMQQLGVDLEQKRMKDSVELQQWEKDAEFERQKAVLDAIENYQKNMGSAAVEIGNAVGSMSIELQAKAQEMIVEKSRLFRQVQLETLHDAQQGINDIQQMYPEDSELKNTMIKPYTDMMANVVNETNAFVLDMKESMKKLTDNINDITSTVLKNTDKYIQPLCGGDLTGLSSTQIDANAIEGEKTKQIEG
ncbi:hypothetical protein [Butyrivibrio sp. NC2007]|uniref:hypothetical protein n=1 Tax=Butyrivibrio sp. NC2007 TaxID=1280683 RepID=UPI0003B61D7A|nr:hypothetical protein [Butyrivibrio sp. NC2007]